MVCPTQQKADHRKRWSALRSKRQTTENDGLPYEAKGRPRKTMVCPTQQKADHGKRWSALPLGYTLACPEGEIKIILLRRDLRLAQQNSGRTLANQR